MIWLGSLIGMDTWKISSNLLEWVFDCLLDESTCWEDFDAQELQVTVVDAHVVHVERHQLVLQPAKVKIIAAVGPKLGAQIGACWLGSDLDSASFVAGV